MSAKKKPSAYVAHEKLKLAFFKAAQKGRARELDGFLAGGVTINERDENGATALFFAINGQNLETTLALIAKGADLNAKVNDGFINNWDIFPKGSTPLTFACMRNFEGAVSALLKGGADVKAADALGLTALHYAAKRGNTALVEALLARGADVKAADKAGHTAEYFARENGYKDLADALQKRAENKALPKPPHFKI